VIRILHLITSFGMGGAEGNLARLVSRMDSTRFSNHIVVMGRLPEFPTEFAAKTVPFQCLEMRSGVPSLRAMYRLSATIRAVRPHVLQTWMYHADLMGLLIGRLTKTPAIAWNLRRSFIGMSEHGWDSRMVLRAAVKFSPLPDGVVTNSLAGQFTHEALGYRPRRWVWIPNSLDADRFRPDPGASAALRAELGLAGNTRLVGLVARFVPIKGHSNFAAAAAILARKTLDAHFVLVGRGIARTNQRLVGMLQSSGVPLDRVHFLGERSDVQKVVAGFDIACSSSYGEGFPNAVGEALACGVPCVVTHVGDSALLVEDDGKVVAPGDPRAFAEACQCLLALSPEQRRHMGLRARRRIQGRYSIQSVVARYEKFYEQLSGAHIQPRAELTGTD
jgi:glycosyltransferase involved in cell wall biosynthesis